MVQHKPMEIKKKEYTWQVLASSGCWYGIAIGLAIALQPSTLENNSLAMICYVIVTCGSAILGAMTLVPEKED